MEGRRKLTAPAKLYRPVHGGYPRPRRRMRFSTFGLRGQGHPWAHHLFGKSGTVVLDELTTPEAAEAVERWRAAHPVMADFWRGADVSAPAAVWDADRYRK